MERHHAHETKLVRRDQFNITPSGIVHKPTEAAFMPALRNPLAGVERMGQLGNQGPAGHDYDSDDVLRMMRELWAEYVANNPRLFGHSSVASSFV